MSFIPFTTFILRVRCEITSHAGPAREHPHLVLAARRLSRESASRQAGMPLFAVTHVTVNFATHS
jgi:hypothetical protein